MDNKQLSLHKEEEIRSLTERISRLENELQDAERRFSELSPPSALSDFEINEALSHQQNEVDQHASCANTNNTNITNVLGSALNFFSRSSKKKDDKKPSAAAAPITLEILKQQNASLQADLEEARKNRSELLAQIEELKCSAAAKQQQHDEHLSSLADEVDSLRDQVKNLHVELEQKTNALDQKQQAMNEVLARSHEKEAVISHLMCTNRQLRIEISSLRKAEDQRSPSDLPPPRCFHVLDPAYKLPGIEDSVRLLLQYRVVPQNRPDLERHVPTDDSIGSTLSTLGARVKSVARRPDVETLLKGGLSNDDLLALFLFKIEHPYALYRWFGGLLASTKRDDVIKKAAGPFYTHLYRAMKKLPKIKARAARAVVVHSGTPLHDAYKNFTMRFAVGEQLGFWNVASFSRRDDVVNDEYFCGAPDQPAIIYVCGSLEGVDMEPFAPEGMPSEAEILPLCPAMFTVQSVVMSGKKLIVSLEQEIQRHKDYCYIDPNF